MEPPQGAILRDGWWTWSPAPLRIATLPLVQSTYTADWNLCWRDRCRSLGTLVPFRSEGSVVNVAACQLPRHGP
jgi:hypothetical protein